MLKIMEDGLFKSKEYFHVEETPKRIVEFYEFEYYEGSDSFTVVNNVKYYHSHPHILIAKPRMERFSAGVFQCYYFKFIALDERLVSFLEEQPIYIPVETNDKYFDYFYKLVHCEIENELHRNIYKTNCALQLISYIASSTSSHDIQPVKLHRYGKNILKTKEYMDKNFGSHITLETLASIAYLSKNFYRTVFTEMMEISPQKYLTKIRIANAVKMIFEGKHSYNEISQICGFESQSYMNYVIKKETGKTPSQYKSGSKI